MLSRTRGLLSALLFFAALFIVAAALQYLFIRHQIRLTVSDQLDDWADDLRTTVVRNDKWDLTGLRRVPLEAPAFIIMASDGTVIETEGFVTSTIGHVAFPPQVSYDRPVPVTSSLGEQWHLFASRIKGGSVIVGASSTDSPPDIDTRLQECARKFGPTTKSAMALRFRDIDADVDFAVVGDDGTLLDAYGGIPLRASQQSMTRFADGGIAVLEHTPYLVRSVALNDRAGRKRDDIIVLKDVALEQRMLHKSAIFYIDVATASLFASGLLLVLYLYKQRGPRFTCEEALVKDESQSVEFKSSFRWDYREGKANKRNGAGGCQGRGRFPQQPRWWVLVIGVDD
jgi:hypothetical protein